MDMASVRLCAPSPARCCRWRPDRCIQHLHRPERAKSDLDEEIESHLALSADKRERGASAEIARREAEREFGNQALVKDVVRRLWGWVWLESLYRDPAG
jgi:hypothetical protein